MVKTSPVQFDPGQLADEGSRYRARLPLVQFPRLAPLLLDSDGELVVEFSCSRHDSDVFVRGQLQMNAPLQCQRCLEPMVFPIDAPFELMFVPDESTAGAVPEEFDPVVLDERGRIHIVDMVEDELLLQLPTIPRHEDPALCNVSVVEIVSSEAADEMSLRNGRKKPFEVLKDLKLQ